ncbi:MAG: tetratricopeptide repeat protein [Candidatus Eisenbacteria bacterium]|uniref:Tetratricopeptide repeat protein n=1 Tax=Eiseniibacteriota bacterium TaxID=2212470 RepID=A0A538U1J9_UNCEI|nr:MAG: tetratricopeptide repeat protein [Candidatus Eisenbacteria bacterium]
MSLPQAAPRTRSFLAILLLAGSVARASLAAGHAPVLHPGETVRLVMPKGAAGRTSLTLTLVAPAGGPVTIETSTLDFDTRLKVFAAGSAAEASPMAEDDNGGIGLNSRLTVECQAGRDYRVVVRPVNDDWGGPVEVSAVTGPAPALDREERQQRVAAYWDAVEAEGQRTGSAILDARVQLGRGSMHYLVGEYPEARRLLEAALKRFSEVLPPNHPTTAFCSTRLATTLMRMGDFAAARTRYERALAIREKALGPDHPEVATSLNNLANLLRATGEFAAARPLYQRALAIREQALGPDHPDVGESLNNLAIVLKDMGDYAAARPLYERALAVRERALGPDHPDVAASLNNLATVLQDLGDYAAARPLYQRALAISEKVRGPDHPDVAAGLTGLANLLTAMAEYAAARPLYERALAIGEKVYGPDRPEVALLAGNLAVVLQDQGDYAAARRSAPTIRTWPRA